jgi:hypothetical protein
MSPNTSMGEPESWLAVWPHGLARWTSPQDEFELNTNLIHKVARHNECRWRGKTDSVDLSSTFAMATGHDPGVVTITNWNTVKLHLCWVKSQRYKWQNSTAFFRDPSLLGTQRRLLILNAIIPCKDSLQHHKFLVTWIDLEKINYYKLMYYCTPRLGLTKNN